LDYLFFVRLFALLTYISLIIVVVTGLLNNIYPTSKYFGYKFRVWIHIICGSSLLFAATLHIVLLAGTNFNFEKIYQPFTHFDILAWLGMIGFVLIIFLMVSSSVKKYIHYKLWNNLHNLSYFTYIVITIHSVFKANDLWGWLFLILAILSSLAIVMLFIIRIKKGNRLFRE